MSVEGGAMWLWTLGAETHTVFPRLWGRGRRCGGLEGGLIQREQGGGRIRHIFSNQVSVRLTESVSVASNLRFGVRRLAEGYRRISG